MKTSPVSLGRTTLLRMSRVKQLIALRSHPPAQRLAPIYPSQSVSAASPSTVLTASVTSWLCSSNSSSGGRVRRTMRHVDCSLPTWSCGERQGPRHPRCKARLQTARACSLTRSGRDRRSTGRRSRVRPTVLQTETLHDPAVWLLWANVSPGTLRTLSSHL